MRAVCEALYSSGLMVVRAGNIGGSDVTSLCNNGTEVPQERIAERAVISLRSAKGDVDGQR
jgi:hypothetical protein